MVNVFHLVTDVLSAGVEGAKDVKAELAGKHPDLIPLADDLLKVLADLKISLPWVTDELLAEGLSVLAHFLETKKPK